MRGAADSVDASKEIAGETGLDVGPNPPGPPVAAGGQARGGRIGAGRDTLYGMSLAGMVSAVPSDMYTTPMPVRVTFKTGRGTTGARTTRTSQQQ